MTTKAPPPIEERRKPGLSQTLPFPRELGCCQSCGQTADPSDGVALRKWRECDEWDKATRVIVVLCTRCSKRLIDPHPRLYVATSWDEPVPGAMELCVSCVHQAGLACLHPLLKANGGPGLEVRFPQPVRGFLCGPRVGGPFVQWTGKPSACAGREERP